MKTDFWKAFRRERDGIVWYDVGAWLGSSVVGAVSTRHGGVSQGGFSALNLSPRVGDAAGRVADNRQRFCRVLGIDPDQVVAASQVHGNRVARIDARPAASDVPPDADGLVTNQPGIFLRLLYADCVPLLVADRRGRAAGVGHAGWRGTQAGVGMELVRALETAYGLAPAELRAVVGPSIGPCCYAVGPEVVAAFRERWADADTYVRATDGGGVVDLWEANRRQLLACGLRDEDILVAAACTRCQVDEFFSHRGQNGRAGRFGAVAGLRPAGDRR